MGFLSQEQLEEMQFKSLGVNVKISDKASIYDSDQIEIGDHSRIDDFCVVSGKVKIGRNVHIAIFCNVAGGEKGIHLDDFSGLAYGCHVFTQSDDYSGKTLTNPTVPDEFKLEQRHVSSSADTLLLVPAPSCFQELCLARAHQWGALSMITKSN